MSVNTEQLLSFILDFYTFARQTDAVPEEMDAEAARLLRDAGWEVPDGWDPDANEVPE